MERRLAPESGSRMLLQWVDAPRAQAGPQTTKVPMIGQYLLLHPKKNPSRGPCSAGGELSAGWTPGVVPRR